MNDLISRAELFNKLATAQDKADCFSVIQGMEAIDAEPVRHGHWIDAEVIGVDQPTVRCSICGIRFCDLINNHRFMYKHCPNCGAKMDGGE